MNPEPALNAPHPPCNTKQCAQLGLLHCWDLHMLSCVTSHTAAFVSPCSPQQPQSYLPWLCYHSHMDCFPSDSNNKSIRAGLASGKWNQLLSPRTRTLNDLLEHFDSFPFAFFSLQSVESLLTSCQKPSFKHFSNLVTDKRVLCSMLSGYSQVLCLVELENKQTTHPTSKNTLPDSVLSFHTGFSSLVDTLISLL